MSLGKKLKYLIPSAVALTGLSSSLATDPIVETFYPKPTAEQQVFYDLVDSTLENRLNIDYYTNQRKEKESEIITIEDTLENEPTLCALEDDIHYLTKRWGLSYLRGLKNQNNLKVDSPGLEFAEEKIYTKFGFSGLGMLVWSLGTAYAIRLPVPEEKRKELKIKEVKKINLPPFVYSGLSSIGNGVDRMWKSLNRFSDRFDQRKLYPFYEKTGMDRWFFTSMPDDYPKKTNQ